jgi:glycosyltransferase involved in cell wall biosynthesis
MKKDNKISLVSVLIPVYNREDLVGECIESAINQTYRNIEIIIVDNCSNDNTPNLLEDYAKKDGRIKIFSNKTNVGPVLNILECIKNASGEYSKILWSDDYMALDFIEKSLLVFDKETAFVISWWQVFDSKSRENLHSISYLKETYTTKEYFKNILYIPNEKFPVSPGCAIFRTKDLLDSFVLNVLNDDNLVTRNSGAGNDLLLFLNTASRYSKIKVLPEYGSFFRSHEDSLTVANSLDLYYLWSKVSFLVNKKLSSNYLDIFKMRLFLQKKKNKDYTKIYEHITFSNLFLISLFKFIFDRYISKK